MIYKIKVIMKKNIILDKYVSLATLSHEYWVHLQWPNFEIFENIRNLESKFEIKSIFSPQKFRALGFISFHDSRGRKYAFLDLLDWKPHKCELVNAFPQFPKWDISYLCYTLDPCIL